MNEKEGNKLLNQGDDKVHIYENDDAYLFGEEMSGDGSLEVGYKNSFKENEKKIISQKELLNKFNTNLSQDDEQEDENQNEEIVSNENNNNNINNNIDNNLDNNNNIINNQIKNINNSLQDNKFMINDINSDENEEGGEGDDEDNQENEHLSFGENANENENENEKTNENYLIENAKMNKNTLNNNNMNMNMINNINNNNEKEIDNNDNQMNEDIDENESNDSGVPLVTLNFLSICQCCKNSFNSKDNIPYLFKCGHFFCKQCIIEQFTDEEGIKCPNDGLIANSISDLKILNNFITDKTVTQRTSSPFSSPEAFASTGEKKNPKTKNIINNNNNNTDYNNQNYPYKCCEFHKGQKLTHFIEETKELICVYCAFERFKQNQGIQIKEITEKCHDMESEMDSIIEENQYNVGIIQTSLKEIKKNKENEEKKINEIYERFIEMIKTKKDEYLNKIENLFTNNAEKLSQKLELFSNKIEKSESVKEKINIFLNNQDTSQFLQLYELYNKIINELQSVHSLKLHLQKYKFIYEDEMPISRMISKFGEIKLTPKIFNFIGNSNKEEPEIINNNNNYNNMKKYRGIKVKLNNNNNSNYNDMNINVEGNNNACDNNFQTYNNVITDNNNATREDINIKNNSSTNFYKRSLNINNNNNYKINNHNPKNIKCNQQQQQYVDYSSNQQPDNSNSNCINNLNHVYNANSLYNMNKKSNNMINYDKYSIPTHLNNNNNEISNKCRNSSLNGGIRVNTPNSLSKMYNNKSTNNNNHLNIKNNLYDNNMNKKINKYKININQMKNNRNPKTKNNKKNSLQFKYNTNIKSDVYKNKSYTFLDK